MLRTDKPLERHEALDGTISESGTPDGDDDPTKGSEPAPRRRAKLEDVEQLEQSLKEALDQLTEVMAQRDKARRMLHLALEGRFDIEDVAEAVLATDHNRRQTT